MEKSVVLDFKSLSLAYLGDAVIELLAREKVVGDGSLHPSKLNDAAKKYVMAVNQSVAVERMIPLLTEEELSVYRRGRNAKTGGVPKSAKPSEYHRATGMEALFGYLYLAGETERMKELFDAAFDG
ncbi:MAG: ribonuclease III [Clostridia bacterium]|nr:ribonuclease III [Clostridia bacterium]